MRSGEENDMGTNIDDIHHEEYLEEQLLEDQKEKAIEEFINDQRFEYYDQVEEILSNISISDLSEYYKSALNTSIKHELWEYCVTIIWKMVILFFYEKLFQINYLQLLNTDIQNNLDSKNRDCISPLSFNCLKDKTLCDKMPYIWRNLDVNYQNSCRSLLDERNSLSHVNEYPYSEIKFKAYLEKSVELLDYLQNLHLSYSSKTVEVIRSTKQFPNLSSNEINNILDSLVNDIDLIAYFSTLTSQGKLNDQQIDITKEKAIKVFVASSSFDSAYENGMQLIMPIASQFNKDDYSLILEKVFTEQKKNKVNQILPAGRIEEIFEKLYTESINTYPNIKEAWEKFIRKVDSMELSDK